MLFEGKKVNRMPEDIMSRHASKLLKHSPMNHVLGMKIGQTLKSTMGNRSYFNFLQRFLVNWKVRIISDVTDNKS